MVKVCYYSERSPKLQLGEAAGGIEWRVRPAAAPTSKSGASCSIALTAAGQLTSFATSSATRLARVAGPLFTRTLMSDFSVLGTSAATSNTVFTLRHPHSGKALDGNGATLYMGSPNEGDYQRWQFVPAGGQFVRLRHLKSGKMLTHTAKGLSFEAEQAQDAQLWLPESLDQGRALGLRNKASGQALDSNGKDVYMHSANGGSFQRWEQQVARATWMSGLRDDLTLAQLCVPGSHDAGMYELDQGLTLGDQAWYLRMAELATKLNVFTNLWNLITGKKAELTGAVAMIAKRLGLTQSLSAYDQLRAGSRFFDLRPTYRADTRAFHVQHGKAVGPRLHAVLDDVVRFIREHKSETAVLEFSHFGLEKAQEQEFLELLTKHVPAELRLALPRTTAATATVPAHPTALARVPLRELRGKVVLVLDDDNRFTQQLQGTSLPGLYRLHANLPIFDEYANAQDYDKMRQDQADKLRKFGQGAPQRAAQVPAESKLFLLNWTLTPVDNDDTKAITGPSVEEYAAQVNPRLAPAVYQSSSGLFGRQQGYQVNIINLDYVETANPVPLCLEIIQRNNA